MYTETVDLCNNGCQETKKSYQLLTEICIALFDACSLCFLMKITTLLSPSKEIKLNDMRGQVFFVHDHRRISVTLGTGKLAVTVCVHVYTINITYDFYLHLFTAW